MATIVELVLGDVQPEITRSGNNRVTGQNWKLTLNERATQIDADLLLYSLGLNNVYGFPSYAGTPLGTSGLLSGSYKTKRAGDQKVGYFFNITVSYSNNINTSAMSEDPVDADPIYRSENVRKELEAIIDPIAKKVIATSNGKEVFPRFTTNRILKRWIIMRNERTYDDARSQNTVDRLNSDVVGINGNSYDPYSLLLESWEGDPQFDSEGNEYFVCTYKFLVDFEEHHQVTYLDVSTEKDINGDLPPSAIPGKALTKADKLDGNGAYLPKEQQSDPTKYTLLRAWVNEDKPMNFLNFRGRPRGGLNIGTIARRL